MRKFRFARLEMPVFSVLPRTGANFHNQSGTPPEVHFTTFVTMYVK